MSFELETFKGEDLGLSSGSLLISTASGMLRDPGDLSANKRGREPPITACLSDAELRFLIKLPFPSGDSNFKTKPSSV